MWHHTDESWEKNSRDRHQERVRYAYAITILNWHRETGVNLVSELHPNLRSPYLEAVHKFVESNLHDMDVQRLLANEQIGGQFEWAYQQRVSEQQWYQLAHRLEIDAQYPRSLGEAGKYLQSSLQSEEESGEADREIRLRVRVTTREELLTKADQFYKNVATEEEIGIGGKNALLSCSLERTPFSQSARNIQTVTLLHVEALGLYRIHESAQPDDLLEQVRSGALSIKTVVGQPHEHSFHHDNRLES